jgi:hypothetical protein
VAQRVQSNRGPSDVVSMDDAALTAAFCRWVRKGMPDPAPSFDGLRDSLYFVPGDVIEILARDRGLKRFRNFGQAVRQLGGEPPELEGRQR